MFKENAALKKSKNSKLDHSIRSNKIEGSCSFNKIIQNNNKKSENIKNKFYLPASLKFLVNSKNFFKNQNLGLLNKSSFDLTDLSIFIPKNINHTKIRNFPTTKKS
jgi:hypothetical protein